MTGDELDVLVVLVEPVGDWVRLEEADFVMLNVGLGLAEGVTVRVVLELKVGLGVIDPVSDFEVEPGQ